MTTFRPALAHAIAIPPPIVPAPTIATVLIGGTPASFGTPGTLATPRSAKNA
jgi:hypothetical protein